MSYTTVGIRLTADGSAFVNGIDVAKKKVDELGTSATRAGRQVAAGLEPATASFASLGRAAGQLTGIAIGVESVRRLALAYVTTADAATQLQSRLRLVAGTAENTATVYAELFRTAQASRVSFEGLAGTYSQIARASADAGISQERMLGVTKALSQAITISGGSAQSTQAAMMQLSQGLSAGTLRGEELNSILEQTPRVAQAIAQGLGVGIGALRRMGQEGQLTTEVVIEALERAAPRIAAEFGRMVPTIGQAMTQLGNSGLNLVGVMDQMAGASSGVATVLSELSSGIDSFAAAINGNPVVMTFLSALQFAAKGGLAGAALRGLTSETTAERVGRLSAEEASLSDPKFSGSAYDRANRDRRLPGVREELARARAELTATDTGDTRDVRSTALAEREAARASLRNAFLNDPANQSKSQRRDAELAKREAEFRKAMQGQAGGSQADVDALFSGYRQSVDNINEKYKEKAPSTAGARAAGTDRKQALAASLADERAAVVFSERLKITALESLGRQGLRTDEQIVQDRATIQRGAIDAQIELAQQARTAAGADLSERQRATGQINALNRERAAVDAGVTQQLAELAARREEALDKEAQAYRRSRFEANQSIRQSIEQLTEENRAKRISIATGEDEIVVLKQLAIERLEAQLGVDERPDPDNIARLQGLRDELDLLRERSALNDSTRPDAVAAAVREQSDDVTKSLSDALMRGFEDGKNFAENFRDTLKNTIGTMILRPLIEPVVRPIGNAISSGIESLLSSVVGASMMVGGPDAGVLAGDSPLAATGASIRGRRALGGPVSPFSDYMVGEEGPEILRMGKSGGAITPNPATAARMAGPGRPPVSVSVSVNFAGDSASKADVLSAVNQAVDLATGRIADAVARGERQYSAA